MTQIALFRSLNVGGKNVIKMAALTALFTQFGAANARAYIQSGNVLFESADPLHVLRDVSKALKEHHRIDVPVALRSADALRNALERNPFKQADSKLVLIMFLVESISRDAQARVDPQRSPPDVIHVPTEGSEVYLHCPSGIGKTKFTNAYLDKVLGAPSTGRNINTVEALLALAAR